VTRQVLEHLKSFTAMTAGRSMHSVVLKCLLLLFACLLFAQVLQLLKSFEVMTAARPKPFAPLENRCDVV
jgi:hypothetical protein